MVRLIIIQYNINTLISDVMLCKGSPLMAPYFFLLQELGKGVHNLLQSFRRSNILREESSLRGNFFQCFPGLSLVSSIHTSLEFIQY